MCCAILESFRKSFQLNIPYHTILFSNFLYPVHAMLLTATIYLTVGITFERYEAVHHPVDYNQVWKYYSSQGQFCISVSFLGVLIVQVSYFSLVSYVWKICLGVIPGSFTNYVFKKRWVGSPKMSTFIR